jgi:hypothetical protein
MKKRRFTALLAATIGLLTILVVHGLGTAADIPRMTKDELKAKLANPDIIIVDVRAPSDWERSELKIKGAVREDPANAPAWLGKYQKDKTYVFYCA